MGYVFISYSNAEAGVAYHTKTVLERNGIDCWMAPESISSGGDYGVDVPKAIERSSAFLLLLSENSQKSVWVSKELITAINLKRIIIPFQIDESVVSTAFAFHLSNIQRINAFKNLDEAYNQLIERLWSILGNKPKHDTQPIIGKDNDDPNAVDDVVLTTKMNNRGGSVCFEYNGNAKHKVYFDFNKKLWDELCAFQVELLSILYNIDIECVSIKNTTPLGKISCYTGSSFDGTVFYYNNYFLTDKEEYHFVVTTSESSFEISFFDPISSDYAFKDMGLKELNDLTLTDIGINEQKLTAFAKRFIEYCNPQAKKIAFSKRFVPRFYSDYSGGFCFDYVRLD